MSVQTPGNNGNNPQGNSAMSDAFTRAGVSGSQQSQQTGGFNNNTRGQQAGGNPGRGRGQARSSILDINSRLRRPISRNSTGETVQGFVKAINKQIENAMGANYRENYSVHVLDNNSNMIALSTILVCFNLQYEGADHVAVFSLLVEGSSGRLNNRFENINGQQIEIDTVAGDVADRTLWEKITSFLTEAYGRQLKLHNAGTMVLPVELSAEDEVHMHRVVFNATQALYTVVENDVTGAEEPLSVSMVDNGATLSATLDYSPALSDNAVGLPVRKDVDIVLRGAMSQGSNSPHEQVRELTRVGGYIDLVYSEPQQQQPVYGQPIVNQPQRYYPRLVITDLDTEVDAVTPELQLLGLSTATLLGKNMGWGGTFLPRYGSNGPDLRDIGAINFELGLGPDPSAKPERIDTKSDAFGKPQLFQLLSTAVHDALIYSMDIEEVGELAWLHQVFIASANGDQDATRAIITAADNLTDGHFSRNWNPNAPIAIDDLNRVHLGYYEGANGERRDIRDIDYLAMLNLLGERDMPTVINWSRTFDDTNIPLPIRLEQRAKIIKGLLPTARIKGYARRVTFSPDFIIGLNNAAGAAGLVIRPNNLFTDFSGQPGRGNYNAAAFAVNGQQTGGVFNYTQPGFGGYRGNSAFFGRFGG